MQPRLNPSVRSCTSVRSHPVGSGCIKWWSHWKGRGGGGRRLWTFRQETSWHSFWQFIHRLECRLLCFILHLSCSYTNSYNTSRGHLACLMPHGASYYFLCIKLSHLRVRIPFACDDLGVRTGSCHEKLLGMFFPFLSFKDIIPRWQKPLKRFSGAFVVRYHRVHHDPVTLFSWKGLQKKECNHLKSVSEKEIYTNVQPPS